MHQYRHDFEDADSGDETQLEAGVTYTVVSTFVELGMDEVVFTHRVRETVAVTS